MDRTHWVKMLGFFAHLHSGGVSQNPNPAPKSLGAHTEDWGSGQWRCAFKPAARGHKTRKRGHFHGPKRMFPEQKGTGCRFHVSWALGFTQAPFADSRDEGPQHKTTDHVFLSPLALNAGLQLTRYRSASERKQNIIVQPTSWDIQDHSTSRGKEESFVSCRGPKIFYDTHQ